MSLHRRTNRIWRELGSLGIAAGIALTGIPALAADEAGEKGAPVKKIEPWPESRSAESFNENLRKVFGGEGGEAGWGVPDLAKDHAPFARLNTAELKTLLTGNTVYKEGNFSLKLNTDGTAAGFVADEKDLKGKWKVENDQICIDLPTTKYKLDCSYATLVIDRMIFYRTNGKARFTGLVKKG